jgi:hypothetical protein
MHVWTLEVFISSSLPRANSKKLHIISFRVRSDLPGYLSDSEADGVSVINWYHRQFKDAARDRYFKSLADDDYFHSMMSDFFIGKYGGGNFPNIILIASNGLKWSK